MKCGCTGWLSEISVYCDDTHSYTHINTLTHLIPGLISSKQAGVRMYVPDMHVRVSVYLLY